MNESQLLASLNTEAELRSLMVLALAGDSQAHHRLLTRLADKLRRYFSRRLGAVADVEDLIQEVLIAVHTRRHTYDVERPFTSWVYAIAHYKLADLMRRRRDTIPLEEELAVFAADDHEQHSAQGDVEHILATLPAAQRAAIHLTRIEGLSIQEAALRAGQSESLIKVNVHRGMKRLMMLYAGSQESVSGRSQ